MLTQDTDRPLIEQRVFMADSESLSGVLRWLTATLHRTPLTPTSRVAAVTSVRGIIETARSAGVVRGLCFVQVACAGDRVEIHLQHVHDAATRLPTWTRSMLFCRLRPPTQALRADA